MLHIFGLISLKWKHLSVQVFAPEQLLLSPPPKQKCLSLHTSAKKLANHLPKNVHLYMQDAKKSLMPGSHICGRRCVPGVQCVPGHWFRFDSGPNFSLNSHLNWTQRCTRPFSIWAVTALDMCKPASLTAGHTCLSYELDVGNAASNSQMCEPVLKV